MNSAWTVLNSTWTVLNSAWTMNPCEVTVHAQKKKKKKKKKKKTQTWGNMQCKRSHREKYTLYWVYIFSLSQLMGPAKKWDPPIVREKKHILDVGYNFFQNKPNWNLTWNYRLQKMWHVSWSQDYRDSYWLLQLLPLSLHLMQSNYHQVALNAPWQPLAWFPFDFRRWERSHVSLFLQERRMGWI